MIASRHFALFATSVATTLLLSACQPATEDNEVMPIEEATQATNEPSETAPEDAHAGHDVAANDVTVNDEKMSDMLKDYTKSMTSMHNEMMVGMGYNDPDTAFAKGRAIIILQDDIFRKRHLHDQASFLTILWNMRNAIGHNGSRRTT